MAWLRERSPSWTVILAVCRADNAAAETWKRTSRCPGRVAITEGTLRYGPPETLNSPASSSPDKLRVHTVLFPAAKVGWPQLSILGWERAELTEIVVL